MARKRSIDPDVWSDDKFTELSVQAGFLYLGLISIADDEGRVAWSAVQLRNRIFIGRVTSSDVEAWMSEIVVQDLMRPYEVDGKAYAYHPSWHKHQFASHALESKLPDPPGITKRYTRGEKSVVDSWKGNKPTRSLVNGSDMAGHGQPSTAESEPRTDTGDERPAMSEPRPPQLVLETYTDTGYPLTPNGGTGPEYDSHLIESEESVRRSQRVPRDLTVPFGFADWFFAEAFGLGLLGMHEPDARDRWCKAELKAAGEVLKNGVDESQIRARRLLLAIKSGELTKCSPNVRTLLRAWNFGCVRADSAKKPFEAEPKKFGSLRPEDRDGGSLGKTA